MTTPSNSTTGSPFPEHTGDASPDSWERVASSLRACKDAQRQAWGDLDSSTLGRYLAGEVADDELGRIERELADHPELRQLTDLVRDVLGQLEPIDEAESGPTVLSFEKARKPRRVLPFLRRHAALVAAACLLIVLGAVIPAGGILPSHETVMTERSSGQVAFMGDPVARASATSPTALFTGLESLSAPELVVDATLPPRMGKPEEERRFGSVQPDNSSPGGPSGFAKVHGAKAGSLSGMVDSKKMSSRDAAANHRRGQDLLRRGRVNDAEKSLALTYAHCQESLGAKHPITTQAAQDLANLYAPVLNSDLELRAATTAMPHPIMPVGIDAPSDKRGGGVVSLGEQIAGSTLPQLQATVVPVLVRALETAPTAAQRQTMVVALGNLGPAAGPALPALRQSFENGTPAERQTILRAMGRIGPASVPILDQLAGNIANNYVSNNASNYARKTDFRYIQNDRNNLSTHDQQLVNITLRKLQAPEAQAGIADEAACLSFREIRTGAAQLHRLAKAKELGILVLIQTKATNRLNEAGCPDRLGKYGVHVILDTTGQVEVKVSPALESAGFSASAIRAAMLAPCKARQYDKACIAGIDLILAQAAKLKSTRR